MHTMQWYPVITGHNGLFYELLFDLVPPEALKNVSAMLYKTYLWPDGKPIGERQQAFARKLAAHPKPRAPARRLLQRRITTSCT
jgi:branched-chain amino acid transport system substrate-binding protein